MSMLTWSLQSRSSINTGTMWLYERQQNEQGYFNALLTSSQILRPFDIWLTCKSKQWPYI
jgi:hypothetical protein